MEEILKEIKTKKKNKKEIFRTMKSIDYTYYE